MIRGLGGENGLKEVGLYLVGHARPGVDNSQEDIFAADDPEKHVAEALDLIFENHIAGRQDLLPGESEELPGECGSAFGCGLDVAQERMHLAGGLDDLHRQLGVAQGSGEHVVEIVGNPASQAANRLHLDCLLQLVLETFTFGKRPVSLRQIARNAEKCRLALIPHVPLPWVARTNLLIPKSAAATRQA